MRPITKLALAALGLAVARNTLGWAAARQPVAIEPGATAYTAQPLPAPALEVDGIPVYAEGQGEDVVLMLHGWPDTCRLWNAQVDAFQGRHRCVRFTLPGFDIERGPRPQSLAQTVALIARVADAVSPARPVTLLLHDWGCVFGYQYALTHPARVGRIVGVDVGDAGSPAHQRSLTVMDKAMVAAYQLWLAAAWRVGGAAGDAMSRGFARLAHAPVPKACVGHAMDYPYYLLWSGAYADFQRRIRHFDPPAPMLYVYGRRKPLQFHSPSWAAKLAGKPGSRVLGMDTGHWPMTQQPAAFNEAVLEWLEESSNSGFVPAPAV